MADDDPLAGIDMSQYKPLGGQAQPAAPAAPAAAPAAPAVTDPNDPLAGVDMSQYMPLGGRPQAQAQPQAPVPQAPQPQGAVANAVAPVASYWGNYTEDVNTARQRMAEGVERMQNEPGFWNKAKGAWETIGGASGYAMSPIDAAVHSIVGQPVQNVTHYAAEKTGLPVEVPAKYTDFATEMAMPGIGFGKMPGAVEKATSITNSAHLLDTPEFASALKKSGVNLTPADIPPEFRATLGKVLAEKGISPATVKEGMLSASGAGQIPRSVTTGIRALPDAAEAAQNATDTARSAVTGSLADVAKSQGTDIAGLGEAFHRAAKNSEDAYGRLYDAASKEPGAFTPKVADTLYSHIGSALANEPGFPKTWEDLAATDHLSGTRDALQHLQDRLYNNPPSTFDMDFMNRLRKDVTRIARKGSPEDKNAAGVIGNAFDNGVISAAMDPNQFSGGVGMRAAANIEGARQAFIQHQQNFVRGAAGPVKSAMNTLPEDLGAANSSHFQSIGSALGKKLMDPAQGPLLYDRLKSAGMGSAVDDYVRSNLLQGKTPDHVAAQLSSPLAQRVFSPSELQEAKFHNASHSILATPQKAAPRPSLIQTVTDPRNLLRAGVRVGLPYLGFHEAGFTGAALAAMGEQAGEHMLGKLPKLNPVTKELAGAPSAKTAFGGIGTALRNAPAGVANAVRSAAPPATRGLGAATRLNTESNAQEDNLRRRYGLQPAYASGGKVGHQHLVDRLITAVETAKKAEKDRTSSLLSQPDEHVAKALKMAQAAI